jgi:hypothetical protein
MNLKAGKKPIKFTVCSPVLWIRIRLDKTAWVQIRIPVEAGKTRRFHGVSKLEVSQKARKLSEVFTKFIAFLPFL